MTITVRLSASNTFITDMTLRIALDMIRWRIPRSPEAKGGVRAGNIRMP